MAVIGVSAKLEFEYSSAWHEVFNVKSMNFPDFVTSVIDTTSLANADFAKSFAPGMVDGDKISFTSEYTSASYVALSAQVRNIIGWRVTGPTGEGDIVTCDGFLTKLSISLSPDEEVMINGEIKMTGLPVIS